MSHTGGTPGFYSSLIYFSDQEIAVAVIVNASPAPAGVDAHFIAANVAGAALASLEGRALQRRVSQTEPPTTD